MPPAPPPRKGGGGCNRPPPAPIPLNIILYQICNVDKLGLQFIIASIIDWLFQVESFSHLVRNICQSNIRVGNLSRAEDFPACDTIRPL